MLQLTVAVGGQTMGVGDVIYIRNDEDGGIGEEAIELGSQWFGQVLEIRAHDEQMVFVRTFWIYRPQDLPGGRRPWHGKNELIPSNHMDIVDAQSVNGKVHIYRWMEKDEEPDLDPDSFYWRQYLDYQTGKLSVSNQVARIYRVAS